MILKVSYSALCITRAEYDLTVRPLFRVLNFHQRQSAYLGFAACISLAMHLVEAHKS